MARLRKMMLEELQRRNVSEDTTRNYIHTVEDFARYLNRPPDRLGLRHIREYQAHLFQKRKSSSGSVTNQSAVCRRAIGRILSGNKKQCEEGVYASKPEAERSFLVLVEKEPACRESAPEMKRDR